MTVDYVGKELELQEKREAIDSIEVLVSVLTNEGHEGENVHFNAFVEKIAEDVN